MSLYPNISNRELPTLLRCSHEQNGGDMRKTAHDIESIDIMLGVMKARTLINSRDRKASSQWTRGRGLHKIIENVLLRDKNQ